MRRLLATEIGVVLAFAAGMLVTYVGLALTVSGRYRFAGILVLAVGIWSTVSAPVVHDQEHRHRGEPCHAVWGRNDRRKPRWWPTTRWPG